MGEREGGTIWIGRRDKEKRERICGVVVEVEKAFNRTIFIKKKFKLLSYSHERN